MKRTLEALWNGQIAPGETSGINEAEMEGLTVLIDRNRGKLERMLTREQKEIFNKYVDCMDEFVYLSAAQAFCDGFCLASRFLMEALSDP